MLGETVRLRALGLGLDSFEILRSSGVTEKTTQLASGENVSAWYGLGPWHEHPDPARGVPASAGSDDDILLASFGAEFVERVRETVMPLLGRPSEENNEMLGSAMRELRKRLHTQLEVLGVQLDTNGPSDVIVTPPGAQSTSFNFPERRYMGLHIDQHDGLPLACRGQARRICVVNVGWLHRYMYVYPRHLMDLCHAMAISPGVDDQDPPSREVTARYFAAHPDAGILRIRLESGYGYLLNAQDLVHDGATPEGDAPGVAFHSMGTLQAFSGG